MADMEELREMLIWLKPDIAHTALSRQTRLTEDLRLSACDGLGLVAMIEARYGRILGWEQELATLGDLLDYLAARGIGADAPDV